jgi:hypothetical protein
MRRTRFLLSFILISLIFSATVRAGTQESIYVTLTGHLQTLAVDERDKVTGEWKSRVIHHLRSEDGKLYQIEDPKKVLKVKPAEKMILSGRRIDNKVYVDEAASLFQDSRSIQTIAESLPETLGEQRTLVALFNYPDKPIKPFTLQQVKDRVLNNTDSADSFIKENSYGKTWLTVDFIDWQTLPHESTYYTG